MKNALMFASAGVLLIMVSCNNANSEKAESSMEAEIVSPTDSNITTKVDTAVSATQDTADKVENDIYDWEEYEKGVMLQLSKTFERIWKRISSLCTRHAGSLIITLLNLTLTLLM